MNELKKLSGWLSKGGAVLIIGLLIGSGLSGCGVDQNEPPDYKALLKEASRYVDEIEQKNEKLIASLEDMKKKVKKEVKGDDDGNGHETLDEVMAENQALIEEKEALIAEIAQFKSGAEEAVTQKMASLEAKNRPCPRRKQFMKRKLRNCARR